MEGGAAGVGAGPPPLGCGEASGMVVPITRSYASFNFGSSPESWVFGFISSINIVLYSASFVK